MQLVCVFLLYRETFEAQFNETRLLILQCDSGDVHSDLIACARYNVTNEHNQTDLTEDGTETGIVHVLLIVQLPRIAGGCFIGFQVNLLFVSYASISKILYVTTISSIPTCLISYTSTKTCSCKCNFMISASTNSVHILVHSFSAFLSAWHINKNISVNSSWCTFLLFFLFSSFWELQYCCMCAN